MLPDLFREERRGTTVDEVVVCFSVGLCTKRPVPVSPIRWWFDEYRLLSSIISLMVHLVISTGLIHFLPIPEVGKIPFERESSVRLSSL
jgi:hypothetical protein